ncbi:hypothetical protein NLG97_g5636 [Lecanicillium saksenae]|uniref:Uncharacterized protein n=1 Tax=Lecanicillium saksenae TaxID=468837 RepID=A0ACC1QT92_9HYPO|nr:hypothetical protein NLG97_g5636 [Lecanicillium saksenae]
MFLKAIGPNEPAPAGGKWPKVPVHLIVGGQDSLPAVQMCFYQSLDCYSQPWEYGYKPWPYPDGTEIGDPEDDDGWGDYDGPAGDELIACSPTTTSTTTTTSDKPIETSPRPERPSPRVGDPELNKRDCYKNTRGIDHNQADELIKRFCGEMELQLLNSGEEYANQWPYSPPGQIAYYVRLWFGISKNTECRWVGGKSKAARSLDGLDGLNGTSVARRDVTDSSLCSRYMDAIVDSCNCGGINGKEGGKISNDCFYVGIHPVNKF